MLYFDIFLIFAVRAYILETILVMRYIPIINVDLLDKKICCMSLNNLAKLRFFINKISRENSRNFFGLFVGTSDKPYLYHALLKFSGHFLPLYTGLHVLVVLERTTAIHRAYEIRTRVFR